MSLSTTSLSRFVLRRILSCGRRSRSIRLTRSDFSPLDGRYQTDRQTNKGSSMNIGMMQTGCCLFDCILCFLEASLLLQFSFCSRSSLISLPRVCVLFINLVFLSFGTRTNILEQHPNPIYPPAQSISVSTCLPILKILVGTLALRCINQIFDISLHHSVQIVRRPVGSSF